GNVARERMLAKALLHSFRQGKHAGHSCGMYAIARTRPSGAKGRPFSASTTTANAAQFELRSWEESGQVKWLHWVDLALARAWALDAIAKLDAIVSRFGAASADATLFESLRSADSPFTSAIKEALQSLVYAHTALDLPTLINVQYRGKSHALVQSRVSYNPEARLRVHTVIDGLSAFRPVNRAWLDPSLARATSAIVGTRELEPDRSVVVDVLTRAIVEQGSFAHAQQWIAQQPANVRIRYAWRGRRPWSLLGYDANDFQFEYEFGPALWTQRIAWMKQVRELQDIASSIHVEPWNYVAAKRAKIAAYNRKIARDWGDSAGLIHPGTDPRATERFLIEVQALANQRSEQDLLRSRNNFIASMRSNTATLAAITGAISAGVGGLVISLVSEFFAFIVQAVPRDWLAIGETLPPPLPLPFLMDGDEEIEKPPSLSVPSPFGFQRVRATTSTFAPVQLQAATALTHSTTQTLLARTPQEPVANGTINALQSPPTPTASPGIAAPVSALVAGGLGMAGLAWWLSKALSRRG
ncbi:MAG: hypothetical protein Q8Q09_20490, partial [Deltaproteobacteria bacterium]|nr:hypothetical protein [Deltaproteobacteria bacterium]